MPHTPNIRVAPTLDAEDPDLRYWHSDVVAEYLDLGAAVTAQFDRYLHLLSQLTTTAVDETQTVAVTLNSNGDIDNVRVRPDARFLDGEIVNARLNEALRKATAILENAKAEIAADYSRELAVLHARSDSLNVLIDAGPLACIPPATSA
jgi:DNA-binding protein YbaB